MAFPQVASITETSFGTNATAHLVAMPVTVDANDLLLVLFANDGDATVTTPVGWTVLSSTASGTEARFSTYAKDADGTEDGTTVDFVTSATEKAAAQCYRITGWQDSGTITNDVEVGTAATGTDTDPDSPSLNPANWDVEDTLWIACYGSDGIQVVTTYPTNYTNGVDTFSGGGGAQGTEAVVASARRENAVASEDPPIFDITAGTARWAAQTIAIRPAGAAPSGHPAGKRFGGVQYAYNLGRGVW